MMMDSRGEWGEIGELDERDFSPGKGTGWREMQTAHPQGRRHFLKWELSLSEGGKEPFEGAVPLVSQRAQAI